MLYTPEYQELQQEMHRTSPGYGGVHSRTYAGPIITMIEKYKPDTVLDYGAGRGHFGEMLFKHGYKGRYVPYDPGIPYWSKKPDPAPFVLCIDVLEHIEPDCLEDVLDDLRRVTVGHGVFSVHILPAKKTLPDGRNAHLTQQPVEWWKAKLERRFKIVCDTPTYAKRDLTLLIGGVFEVEPRDD